MIKKLACYDFTIKYIKSENNVGADVLSKKPNYKNPNKLIKPILVKNGNYMQITETTKKKQRHHQKCSRHEINRASKNI